MTADGPTPVTAEPAATLVAAPGDPLPPAVEIATLPPTPAVGTVGINPRTGEPRRPLLMQLAAGATWAAAAAAAASLLWTYWVAVEDFFRSSWLADQFDALWIWQEVLIIAALTIATLLVVIAAAITGYYAWFGHRWTRIAGIVSAALSPLMLLLTPVGWAAIPLALLGAGLLWTPRAAAFFAAWQTHRHPDTAFSAPVSSVRYGPLPRYRKA